MRRVLIFALTVMLLSGGSVASCLAAIGEAQARRCCATNCPDKPAHNPSRCCSVSAAQEVEVAPTAHSAGADALAQVSMAPAAGLAIVSPAIASVPLSVVNSPPQLSPPLLTLCSLQL
jgi:hypothetical protein